MSTKQLHTVAVKLERMLNQLRTAYSVNNQPKADTLSTSMLYVLSDLNEQGIEYVLVDGAWMHTEDGTF